MNSGFRIGTPGQKYGLVKPKPQVKLNNVFGNDDDDSAAVQQEIDKIQKKKEKQIIQQYSKVLEDDPSAYDYDGVYDDINKKKEQQVLRRKEETNLSRQPKYMNDILKKVEDRKREQEVIYDRLLQKEKEKEQADGKEMFITAAYKKKLQEDKRWEEEDEKREKAVGNAERSKTMTGFYANLLDNNVALGTAKQPQKTEPKIEKTESGAPKAKMTKEDELAALAAQARKEKHPLSTPENIRPTSPKPLEEKIESSVKTSTPVQTSSPVRSTTPPPSSMEPRVEMIPAQAPSSPIPQEMTLEEYEKHKQKRTAEQAEEEKKKWVEKETAKLARRNDESAISDAKARYLARKAQMQKELDEAREKTKLT